MDGKKCFITDLILRMESIISKGRDLPAKDIETLKEAVKVLKEYQGKDDNSPGWVLQLIVETLPPILKFLMDTEL